MIGKFITVEGTEGAGKSTAMRFIEEYLSPTFPLVLTREPGGTKLAEAIRHLLLHAKETERVAPMTELLLMFAARAQHIHHLIKPSLQAGKWVVSDRYIDATYAYQVGGRELNLETISLFDKQVVGDVYPDLTILLDIPAELGMQRTEKRGGEKDRIEQEQISFFDRVRTTYLERAKADPKRMKVIDASLDLTKVQAQLRAVLDEFIKSQSL